MSAVPGRSDLRDAWTLTRTELRSYVRQLGGSTRRGLSVLTIILTFSVLFPLLLFEQTTAYGAALATGSVPLGASGRAFGAVTVAAGYIGAAGGFNQERVGTVGPLVRTSIAPIAVSLGRFANRTIQAQVMFVPAAVVLLAGVAIGAGSLALAGLVAVGSLPLFAAALVSGRIVGDLARLANERIQVSLWVKLAFGLGLMGLGVGVVQLLINAQIQGAGVGSIGPSGPILPGTPLQSYATVVFAPLGVTTEGVGIAVAGVVLATIPVGLIAMTNLETRMLVRDLGTNTSARPERSRRVPNEFQVTPAAGVAWRYLLRTRRDPRTLAHLSPVLFGTLGMAGPVLRDPSLVFTVGPAATAIVGSTMAGAAYCLNPLGDDRKQLPLLLTSTESVGVLLRGRMLAGVVLGLVVGICLGIPLGLVAYSPTFIFGQTLLTVFLAVASTGIAIGLGAIVPKFEQRSYMSIERAHPSKFALMAFFFGGIAIGGVGYLLLWATMVGADPVMVALGWIVYLGGLGIASYEGYRYAVRRMDALRLDQI